MNTHKQHGQQLSTLLALHSHPDIGKKVAGWLQFNDTPFFGQKKRKAKLIGELVTLNSAIIFKKINIYYNYDDSKLIIDSFLDYTRKGGIFRVIESQYPQFSKKYEENIQIYHSILADNRINEFVVLANTFNKHIGNGKVAIRMDSMFVGYISSVMTKTEVMVKGWEGAKKALTKPAPSISDALNEIIEGAPAGSDMSFLSSIANSSQQMETRWEENAEEGKFGYDVNNPIKTNGIRDAHDYLSRLKWKGEPISSKRIGTNKATGTSIVIDCYQIFSKSKQEITKLHINIYNNCTSKKAPTGFTF